MAGPDNPDDLAALAGYAATLADGIVAAIPGWVQRVVAERAGEWDPRLPAQLADRAAEAGAAAAAAVGPQVVALLERDVDAQRTSPLEVVRGAVPFATEVLAGAGVAPVARDEVRQRLFPDDAYDLVPATFGDLDPALADAGIAWGAAKAHVVLARRRAEGLR